MQLSSKKCESVHIFGHLSVPTGSDDRRVKNIGFGGIGVVFGVNDPYPAVSSDSVTI